MWELFSRISDPDEQLLNTTTLNEVHAPRFITNAGSYIIDTKSKARISSSRICLDRNGWCFNCIRMFRRNCLNNFKRATETRNNSVRAALEITGWILVYVARIFERSFVITSMVTYSTQRECAVVLRERVIYAIWKMLYLVRRATDAYDCTEWPLIIHNARRFRKYSRCRSLARERDSQSKKRRNGKTGFPSPPPCHSYHDAKNVRFQGGKNYGQEEVIFL